jgi:hypothetical protein
MGSFVSARFGKSGLSPAFTLASCSAYSALKMDVICSFETSVGFQQSTRRYIHTIAVRTSNPIQKLIRKT